MSEKHLSTGSVEPPRVPGLLRLYSMEFCPFAQRARLVLKAKGIPHDIVNINLINKPEWYFKIHPEGKVPALLDGDKIIVESLDIADYLDEKYPEKPLYPAEPSLKQKEKELIQSLGAIIGIFVQSLFDESEKPPEEWLKEYSKALQPLEDELAKRGTEFFGGDTPNMLDLMLWPWGERAGTLAVKHAQKVLPSEGELPHLRKWRKAMKEYPVAKEMYHGPEKFWKVVLIKLKKEAPNYDDL